MRQGLYLVIVAANVEATSRRFVFFPNAAGSRVYTLINQSVNDPFFSRLDDAGEDRIHQIVRNRFDRMGDLIGIRDLRISGGECDEQIARSVSGNGASARESERDPASEPFQLMRQERRIGRNDRYA